MNQQTGSIKINFPTIEPSDLDPYWSCALDVADRGWHTLESVAGAMNLTRERIRQIELYLVQYFASLTII